jgi:hypothetical protein
MVIQDQTDKSVNTKFENAVRTSLGLPKETEITGAHIQKFYASMGDTRKDPNSESNPVFAYLKSLDFKTRYFCQSYKIKDGKKVDGSPECFTEYVLDIDDIHTIIQAVISYQPNENENLILVGDSEFSVVLAKQPALGAKCLETLLRFRPEQITKEQKRPFYSLVDSPQNHKFLRFYKSELELQCDLKVGL